MGLGDDLEREAKAKNVSMHRLGHVDDEIYRSALSAATLMVLPSEYEAFGIVLLEAAAAKTPVRTAKPLPRFGLYRIERARLSPDIIVSIM